MFRQLLVSSLTRVSKPLTISIQRRRLDLRRLKPSPPIVPSVWRQRFAIVGAIVGRNRGGAIVEAQSCTRNRGHPLLGQVRSGRCGQMTGAIVDTHFLVRCGPGDAAS